MTALSITPGAPARTYSLQDGGRPVASLQLARSFAAGGEIRTADGVWPVVRAPHHWWQITVGDPQAPLLELGQDEARVPGLEQPVPWKIRGRFSHFHATLGSAAATLVLDCSGWRDLRAEVQVSGTHEQRDMVVLACFFALLARRRRSALLLST